MERQGGSRVGRRKGVEELPRRGAAAPSRLEGEEEEEEEEKKEEEERPKEASRCDSKLQPVPCACLSVTCVGGQEVTGGITWGRGHMGQGHMGWTSRAPRCYQLPVADLGVTSRLTIRPSGS